MKLIGWAAAFCGKLLLQMIAYYGIWEYGIYVISFERVLSVMRGLALEVFNVRVSAWVSYDVTINTVVISVLTLTVLTHIMQICSDFDVANSL